MKRAFSALCFLVIALGLTHCSSTLKANNPYLIRLKNRGPVPLSSENPYLAGNALLLNEIKNSQELNSFLKKRGGPAALEVRQHIFSPLAIELYYPEKREFYKLEEIESVWLINGPYPIDRIKMQELAPILIPKFETPAILSDRFVQNNLPPTDSKEMRGSLKPPARISTESKPAPPIRYAKKNIPVRELQKTATDQKGVALLKSLMKKYGNGLAEIAPNGDLIHYVISSNESMAMLARWYTFDVNNKLHLAEYNQRSDSKNPSVGESILIPKNLLRNENRLTEEALEELKQAVANGRIK